jgi:hypothetical protein
MKISRQELVELLRENGDMGTAHQVESTLPEEIETDRDQKMLSDLGVEVDYLMSRR